MGEFAIGLGMLLAVFGPLLLLPVTWAVYRWVARPALRSLRGGGATGGGDRGLAAAISVLLVAGVVAGSWFPGHLEFRRQCALHATPVIHEVTRVDGFHRSRLYPHEARRFLDDFGFAYVEAPHLHRAGVTLRYSRTPQGEFTEQEVPAPRGGYAVTETLSRPGHGVQIIGKRVHTLPGDRELARAAVVVFEGGPLAIFLGAYAMESCPDIRSAEGSRDFRTYYDLERVVLRAPAAG